MIITLQDILDTCNRHIQNSTTIELDCIDNHDLTELDKFYIYMFRESWKDLKYDIETMLTLNQNSCKIKTS